MKNRAKTHIPSRFKAHFDISNLCHVYPTEYDLSVSEFIGMFCMIVSFGMVQKNNNCGTDSSTYPSICLTLLRSFWLEKEKFLVFNFFSLRRFKFWGSNMLHGCTFGLVKNMLISSLHNRPLMVY